MFFIGNILYQSVTRCNKTIHRKKKKEGAGKNVTSATNGLYRDFGVSFCDKLQQESTCVYLEKKIRKGEKKT